MSASIETLKYWLALAHAPGVGPVGFGELLERYAEPSRLFLQPGERRGLPVALRSYLANPDWAAVERCLDWLGSDPLNHIIIRDDPRYPARLRVLADAPPLLYLHGQSELLDAPQLAVVGSRNPSVGGRETARDFARHLAAMGITITSGLAQGIDAAAHQGALDGGGTTIAVFGTGPDRVYPAEHRELAHRIVDSGGALVSEYPPGVAALPGNFPRRNRIISALALGTLVVEAALRSGSLITARNAMEQGREVFAVPGSIHNPMARGCHRLIRDGAKLVETAQDILEELAPQLQAYLREGSSTAVAAAAEALPELDEDYRLLLASLGDGPCPVDLLVERSGLTPEVVSSMLLSLELQGWVISSAGGYVPNPKR